MKVSKSNKKVKRRRSNSKSASKSAASKKSSNRSQGRSKGKSKGGRRGSMSLFSIKYQTINIITDLPSGTSGTIISASDTTEARYIFKCSHVASDKIKYKIISVEKNK